MKSVLINFTDGEHKKLLRLKGELTWRELILLEASRLQREVKP